MGDFGKHILTIAIVLSSVGSCFAGTSLSAMTVDEVTALLAHAGQQTDNGTVSAKDTVAETQDMILLPVSVTAEDMLNKLFGVVDPGVSKDECVSQSRRVLRLTPEEEDGVLWLESDGGYGLNYYGMFPAVSAMARYGDGNDGGNVNDFGYFFLFPYSSASKQKVIGDQADFCGCLLQEMADMGLALDLYTATDDLFEAVCDYEGNFVNIRLLDDKYAAGAGRFILILSIEPGAFTAVDYLMAEET